MDGSSSSRGPHFDSVFCRKLREERVRKSLSLREVASKTGISHGQLCRYENGFCEPSPKTLRKLRGIFDLEIKARKPVSTGATDFNWENAPLSLQELQILIALREGRVKDAIQMVLDFPAMS